MASTYEKIATNTLSSAQSSITFSSIPSTYTDLVLISNAAVSSGAAQMLCRLNSDTGSNYSFTRLGGDGSTTESSRASSVSYMQITWFGYLTTTINQAGIANFMNYSNSTTNKTVLTRSNNAGNGVGSNVNLWRSTSAINTILLYPDASTFATGSTFTLYGIKAA